MINNLRECLVIKLIIMTGQKDFEVISNPDEDSSSSCEPMQKDYSQDDNRFMVELYKENRHLQTKLAERDKQLSQMRDANVYLKKSNVFWMCCYIGSVFCTLISLS